MHFIQKHLGCSASSEASIKKARNGRKLPPNDIKAEDIEDDILSGDIQLIKPLLTESAWVLLHKEGTYHCSV